MSGTKRKRDQEAEAAASDSDNNARRKSKKESSKKSSKAAESDSDDSTKRKSAKKSSKKSAKKQVVSSSSDSDSESEKPIMPVKRADEQIEETSAFVDLGSKRRVTISKFHGNTLIDIRQFYEKHGDLAPGTKGLSLSVQQWEALKRNMERIDKMIEQAK